MDEDDLPEDDVGADDGSRAGRRLQRLAEEKARLLSASLAGQDDTLTKRVALVLNHFPDTRDSDVALQLRYWTEFGYWKGGPIAGTDLYDLPKLTSLSRARAKIQNQLGLFQATATVKRRRRMLEDEGKESARRSPSRSPSLTVFADESGKTDANLIVGGIWFADRADVFRMVHVLKSWRERTGFESELHYKEISEESESRYREAFELVFENAPSASFKALRHPRKGLRHIDDALDSLFYHLIVRGVQHENDSQRAPLPRSLQLWKDAEDPSRDTLRLANLKDRVSQAGVTLFQGMLTCADFQPVESHEVDLMQIADLFIGAIARRINQTPGPTLKAKDRFADFVLRLVGMTEGPDGVDSTGDVALATTL